MAAVQKTSDVAAKVRAGGSEPQLPVLRFGLKQLFWCVTGLSLLLAALVASAHSDSMSPVVMLLFVLAVALHVGGTAIGNRLRTHANERRAWEAARRGGDEAEDRHFTEPLPPTVFEPSRRSPWHGYDRPIRRLPLLVLAGLVFGGCAGLVVLGFTIGHRSTLAGIAVGSISTAVLGAWLAFVAASSWAIFRRGWRDAVEDHDFDETQNARPS